MKYSDTFFKFPVRIYDPYELERAVKQEEMTDSKADEPGYAVGVKKLKYTDITGWYDVYTRELDLDEILNNGFPCTLVQTKDEGDYLCNWERKRFEDELNKFVEKMSLDSIKPDKDQK